MKETVNEKEKRGEDDQARGGGRFWIAARPGGSTAAEKSCPARPCAKCQSGIRRRAGGGGMPATGEEDGVRAVETWSRRTQQSISAGFWAASRSSVMEMAGSRMKQQHRQGHHLRRRSEGRPIKSQPQADHRDGQQRPGEIEGLLHSRCRFYIRVQRERKQSIPFRRRWRIMHNGFDKNW